MRALTTSLRAVRWKSRSPAPLETSTPSGGDRRRQTTLARADRRHQARPVSPLTTKMARTIEFHSQFRYSYHSRSRNFERYRPPRVHQTVATQLTTQAHPPHSCTPTSISHPTYRNPTFRSNSNARARLARYQSLAYRSTSPTRLDTSRR